MESGYIFNVFLFLAVGRRVDSTSLGAHLGNQ